LPRNTLGYTSTEFSKDSTVSVVATVGTSKGWISKMDISFNFNEELNNVLMELVREDKITMGVDEEGEIIFWMTDEQKEAYSEEHGYE
jgi:hypothetical protein